MKVKTDREFLDRVQELSGQNLNECYQCGTCSAGCPFVEEMDILPDRLIRLVILGEKERVLGAKTPWICAACFTCTVRCPRGLDIAKIMEAIRQIKLRKRKEADETKIEKIEDIKHLPQAALVSNFRKQTG
ncbi:MAG TPA: heterodisulfide reductase [Thermoplasmata archaeon]|nr:heterodisulfide reductase [Thermoplasmata archaeon]